MIQMHPHVPRGAISNAMLEVARYAGTDMMLDLALALALALTS